MKKAHETIHEQVQNYVTKNAQNSSKDEINKISADIEESTFLIFDKLDDLLEAHCNDTKQ